MFIYSIFDKKGMYHLTQFFAKNDAEATRSVAMEANNSKSVICNFPDDFALYCLGECNLDTGVISPAYPLKFIVEVASLIGREEK